MNFFTKSDLCSSPKAAVGAQCGAGGRLLEPDREAQPERLEAVPRIVAWAKGQRATLSLPGAGIKVSDLIDPFDGAEIMAGETSFAYHVDIDLTFGAMLNRPGLTVTISGEDGSFRKLGTFTASRRGLPVGCFPFAELGGLGAA